MTKDERRSRAEAYFIDGYNCAQAIVLSFAEEAKADAGVEKDQLLKIASSFGGGMGRMREVCGAVSGMFVVYGILRGYDGAETGDVKMQHYADIQELARRFKEKNGSIVCRELLEGISSASTDPTPSPRTPEYYKKRPCNELVGDAAEILHNFLEEK